ncbi:hypothetical protein DACRYDRAFT_23961 [Dacryopinax primogenitus]|uniref:Uncharacterized protein n=1 Tax=Dacryopinax primogenitus (strain DJM 731) TaxID=1858805 RepID=M5FTL5_DACPD|nr:uncharacterized protein DACRYDRAFT_23961 [Dacryopinax primogenitus]EJT99438.1 hypothetical protein DACRYDRAFT_23961 [Dacryopinax primogenitus]
MELEERGWEELDPRDLDEFQYSLDERGVPNTGLPNNPGIQQSANTVNNNQPQQIQQRSLEDIDDEIDLYARSMPEEELDFEPFSARSVPEDELEWTVDMRDVEGEENLAERNKVGQAMGKAFNII